MGRVLMCKCQALISMMLFRRIYWTHQEQQGRKERHGACVRACDFSYIVPPLDGDNRLFLWVSAAVKTFTLKNKRFCKRKLFVLATTARRS